MAGRPSYESVDGNISKLYLYHATDIRSGVGRWILSHSLNSESHAVQFVDSYAILPHLSQYAADKSVWMVSEAPSQENDNVIDSTEWQPDASVSITCAPEPNKNVDSFYFESSSSYQLELSGFYVRRYSSVKNLPLSSKRLYKYMTQVSVHRLLTTRNPSTLMYITLAGDRRCTSSRCKTSTLG